MGKDVTIEVPCVHTEIRPLKPLNSIVGQATIHFVPVPAEALAEVQEVLKKYQPQMQKFNEMLQKVIQSQHEVKVS